MPRRPRQILARVHKAVITVASRRAHGCRTGQPKYSCILLDRMALHVVHIVMRHFSGRT